MTLITNHHAIYFEGVNSYLGAIEMAKEWLNGRDIDNNPDCYQLTMEAIKVDDVREMQYALSLKPFNDNQVAIIRADALNNMAANALLKVLEEPKADLKFALYGLSQHSLLATIRSRVQIVKYKEERNFSLTDIANERGIFSSYLPIYNELGISIDEIEKFQDRIDAWVEFIQEHAEYRGVLGVMTSQKWLNTFENREQQRMGVALLQHYGKSLLLQKKKKYHLWGTLPDYSWNELVSFNENVSLLVKALHSNGQFVMNIEEFYLKMEPIKENVVKK